MPDPSHKSPEPLSEASPIPPEAIKAQLEKVLASRRFATSGRLSSLLTLIIMQHLEGNGESLKETVIGTELFGRPAGYDPQSDSIVRTTAHRLRAELTSYYEGDGADDLVVIALPEGRYRPQFTIRAQPASEAVDLAIEVPSARFAPIRKTWAVLLCSLAILGLTVIIVVARQRRRKVNSRTNFSVGLQRPFCGGVTGVSAIHINPQHHFRTCFVNRHS
jgi:hypothetical protein